MTPQIIVLSHDQKTYDLLCRRAPFFAFLHETFRVARANFASDIRRHAYPATPIELYQVPGFTLHDYQEAQSALDLWADTGKPLYALSEVQVLGLQPVDPPALWFTSRPCRALRAYNAWLRERFNHPKYPQIPDTEKSSLTSREVF